MWEPADLLPTAATAARPPGSVGFKMCKSAFKLGMRGVLARLGGKEESRYGRGGASPLLPLPTPPTLHSDSDSDEEDTQFFSMASGAPQTPAPESSHRQAQSTFSTLVTVLKGRITALCDAKASSSCPARQACQHHIRNRDSRKLRGLAAPIASLPAHPNHPSTLTAVSHFPAFLHVRHESPSSQQHMA